MVIEDQRNSGLRGTVGSEEQRNSRYRKPEERWAQSTRGTVGKKDEKNRGPEEHRVQRTRTTEDQRNSEHRGPEGTIKPIKRLA